MTKKEAKRLLVAAFRALTPRQRGNLLYHAERGTPIFCGDNAMRWASETAG